MESSLNQKTEGSKVLDQLQLKTINLFVDGTRVLGLPPSLGEIYGLFYISPSPLALDDLVNLLSISKGSASQGLRALKLIGAVKETKGTLGRKTYYEPAVELKRLAGGFLQGQVRPHLKSAKDKLDTLESLVSETPNTELKNFYTQRIERLSSWHRRSSRLLPFIQKFLGK